MLKALLWGLVAFIGIALATGLVAYFLYHHHRVTHFQIRVFRKVLQRARSPWAHEDAAWEQLSQAVAHIPEDLRPSSEDVHEEPPQTPGVS